MTARTARIDGIDIAYRVQGSGPALVLIMGYRLSSAAWPASLIESLARQFTVITLDNRGTGLSDKPVRGYALANLARDVGGVLDDLAIPRVHLLGYSMGGAIAQEFVRQFPERVASLTLCATMCGGAVATYADGPVVRVMRDLDGLSPEQVARNIWTITYAPDYLAQNRALAEEQMRREIALPTPLHAADLQFQAFAEFDGSRALSDIRCPTLVLTGDLDRLIPPQNSTVLAQRIPDAKLIVIPGGGHRVLWECTQDCVHHITAFLSSVEGGTADTGLDDPRAQRERAPPHAFVSTVEMALTLPLLMASAGLESLALARRSVVAGGGALFGDGKPIILMGPQPGGEFALLPLSAWLRAAGYRPVIAPPNLDLDAAARNQALSRLVLETVGRIGRKAVVITHSIGMTEALRTAEDHADRISDVIAIDAVHRPRTTNGPRIHFISTGWSVLHSFFELPRVLREIGIELIEGTSSSPASENAASEVR